MRDAAAAAAMSDPNRNRWFRRRWVEANAVDPTLVCVEQDEPDLDLLGRELLAAWRRERAAGGGMAT
jgi:hypothetical protein